MTELILQLSDVMRAEIKGLDAIANNAANLATPGYRSERPLPGATSFLQQINGLNPAGTVFSQRDGALQTTGSVTDLALRGDGWFVVESPEGPRLTRDGRFHLDEHGGLRTRQGYPVLADNGAVSGLPGRFVVATDGSISHNGKQLAALRLVRVPEDGNLVAAGDGLYRYEGDLASSRQVVVMQGGYEGSNADTASDMLHLMRTTRHIESLQRAISVYDQVLGTGINQLGKP